MPDGYLISVGVKADFSELKEEQKEAQAVVAETGEEMAASYDQVGAAAGESAAKVTAAAHASHDSVSAHKAAAAAMRELEGNFTRNSRAADQFLISSLELGPALQAAFPLVGAAAFGGILFEIGKGAYDAYEKFVSLDSVSEKLAGDFKKMQQADIINVGSIETATERLDKANASATQLRETAEALHSTALKNFFSDMFWISKGAVGTDIGQLIGAEETAEEAARNARYSLALTAKQVELEHELAIAKIEAAHGGDAALSPEQKITAELAKRLAINKEEEHYTHRREQLMGNATPSDSGEELRRTKDLAAEKEAAARRLELNKKASADATAEAISDQKNAQTESLRATEAIEAAGERASKAEEEEQRRKARAAEEARKTFEEETEAIEKQKKAELASKIDPLDEQIHGVKDRAAAKDIGGSKELAELHALTNQKKRIQDDYFTQLEARFAVNSKEWRKYEDERVLADRRADDEMTRATQNAARKTQQIYNQMFTQMYDPLQTFTDHWLESGQRMGAAFQRMADQWAMAVINSLLKMYAQEMVHLAMHKMVGAEERMDDAKTAAANSFKWGSSWGGPIAGAIAAAAAFAAVAAFEDGTDYIPRTGIAMLHQGEAVATAGENSRISQVINLASRGATGGDGGPHFHYSPTISGIDGASVEGMARQHGNTFLRQAQRQLRLQNKI